MYICKSIREYKNQAPTENVIQKLDGHICIKFGVLMFTTKITSLLNSFLKL